MVALEARTQPQETGQFWQECDRLVEPFLQKIRSGIGSGNNMRTLNIYGNEILSTIDGEKYGIRRRNGMGAYEFWSASLGREISFIPKNGSLITPLKLEITDYENGARDTDTEIFFENGKVDSIVQHATKPRLLPAQEGAGSERISMQKERDGGYTFTLGWDGQDLLDSRSGKIEIALGASAEFVSLDSSKRNITLALDGKRFTLPIDLENVMMEKLKNALRFCSLPNQA